MTFDHDSFSGLDPARAAQQVADLTAMILIREGGDGEAAIEALVEWSGRTPPEGEEVLDAAAISAMAIRTAMDLGVMPRV